jgi:hypothetical protein
MATLMLIKRGMAASRVSNPKISNAPHTISTLPTNGAKKCGAGMPIFVNLPTPKASGNRNFCAPSEKNTAPTISRINAAAGVVLFRI